MAEPYDPRDPRWSDEDKRRHRAHGPKVTAGCTVCSAGVALIGTPKPERPRVAVPVEPVSKEQHDEDPAYYDRKARIEDRRAVLSGETSPLGWLAWNGPGEAGGVVFAREIDALRHAVQNHMTVLALLDGGELQ